MTNIQPIVEGHGEVAALPVLLRRLRDEAGWYGVEVNEPIRRPRSKLVQEVELRKSIRLARIQANCGAILVLLDEDDDCPAELGPRLADWARAEAAPKPCAVVLAAREYEAWFLASIESLRGRRGVAPTAEPPGDPEDVRDAKGALSAHLPLERRYSETVDQAAFSALFDLGLAFRRCRSFRKVAIEFGRLASPIVGPSSSSWPPEAWTE